MSVETYITVAAEGELDTIVAQKLIEYSGGKISTSIPPRGKPAIAKNITNYNRAAEHIPWFVLVDLNSGFECAPALVQDWLPAPAKLMCFRVAVREIEAWLMGDPETLAVHLQISKQQIERTPEKLSGAKPKTAMMNLAKKSASRQIRERMIAKDGNQPGPYYTAVLSDYAYNHWRPEVAATRVDSLKRAMHCVERLLGNSQSRP